MKASEIQGFLRPDPLKIPVLRMTEQDIFLRGQPMPYSIGHIAANAEQHPHPRASPTKIIHPKISPYRMYPSSVPLVGNIQATSPNKTCSKTHHRSCSVDLTLTTHPRYTLRSPQVHRHVNDTTSLIHTQTILHHASHHKYNA